MAAEAVVDHGEKEQRKDETAIVVESRDGSLSSQSTTPPPRSSLLLTTIIGGLCLGTFLFGLDLNILGVAIPPITTEFRSLADVAWYGSAYMLTLTAFQPLFGNLYKLFNPKVVYLVSLSIFEGKCSRTKSANSEQTLTRAKQPSSGIHCLGYGTELKCFDRRACHTGARGLRATPGRPFHHWARRRGRQGAALHRYRGQLHGLQHLCRPRHRRRHYGAYWLA